MSEIKQYFERCEECYKSVDMMKIIVKETPDGNCIYCPDCVKHHKYLDEQAKILCKKWGIPMHVLDKTYMTDVRNP